MPEPLKIKCKEEGCPETVEYVPKSVPVIMGMKEELPGIDLHAIPHLHFEKAVDNILSKGIIQATKRVELECDRHHKHMYTVPA